MSAEVQAVIGGLPVQHYEFYQRIPYVVATLGPATDPIIYQVAQHAEVARIHAAHNTIEDYERRAHAFLSAPNPFNRPRLIFADGEGLKFRTSEGTQPTEVFPRSPVYFQHEAYDRVDGVIQVQDDFSKSVSEGDLVSMGDGAMWMHVDSKGKNGIVACIVDQTPGDGAYTIVEHKGLNFPYSEFPDVLVNRDQVWMARLAASRIVPHLIGLSFTQTPQLTHEARAFTDNLARNYEAMKYVRFVQKIENAVGARNVGEISMNGRPGPDGDLKMAAFGDAVPELVQRPRIVDLLMDIHRYSAIYDQDWMACTGLGQGFKEGPTPTTAESIAHGMIVRMGGWLSLSGDELAMNFKYPVQAVRALREAVDHHSGRAAVTLSGASVLSNHRSNGSS